MNKHRTVPLIDDEALSESFKGSTSIKGLLASGGVKSANHLAYTKRYFKIPEAVDYSGHSRSTLYEAHKRGELIFTKFGGATRIEKADLDAYLDSTGIKYVAA